MNDSLPLETQTLYAELLERLTALEAHRSIGRVSGCFTTKEVKGETYCYFQYSDPTGGQKQIYVGKESPTLKKVIRRFSEEREKWEGDVEGIQRLCAQLRVGGCHVTDSPSSRVLKALAESGVFKLGGVLVGTHAFGVLGNLLGVRWQSGGLRTQDVDIACEPILRIVVPSLQEGVPQILEGLEMGFLPVPQLSHKHPSTSFKVRGQSLRVDILTPEVRPGQFKPVVIERFQVAAQPLRFMDYLIEGYEPGVVVNGGGVLVNVPFPGRFAFHKLLISQERSSSMQTKAKKDILQALQLFSFLSEERPGDLELAWESLEKRGSSWVRKIYDCLAIIKKHHPDEHAVILKVIESKELS